MRKLNINNVIELSKTITSDLEKLEADIVAKLKANIGKHRFFKVREYPLLRVSTSENRDHIILKEDTLIFNTNKLNIDTTLITYIYAVKKFKNNSHLLSQKQREAIKEIELPPMINELFGAGLSVNGVNKELYMELRITQEMRLRRLEAKQEEEENQKSERWYEEFINDKFSGYDELTDGEKEVLNAKNADKLNKERDMLWM